MGQEPQVWRHGRWLDRAVLGQEAQVFRPPLASADVSYGGAKGGAWRKPRPQQQQQQQQQRRESKKVEQGRPSGRHGPRHCDVPFAGGWSARHRLDVGVGGRRFACRFIVRLFVRRG